MPRTWLETPVGELVRENLGRSRVFEGHAIDYCCEGGRTLAQACRMVHVDPQIVQRELALCDEQKRLNSNPEAGGKVRDELTLGALIDHIEKKHHAFLREELPRLESLLQKVVAAHGVRHPELLDLQRTFRTMHEELLSHLWKEENVLFPMVRKLEAARGQGETLPSFHCGSVQNPIRVMFQEHQDVGDGLRDVRRLTNGFTPPADACPTYRVLLERLHELELDLHVHIHQENNVLFPRAVQLEAEFAAAGS